MEKQEEDNNKFYSPEQIFDILVTAGFDPANSKDGFRCVPIYRDSDNPNALLVNPNGSWMDFGINIGGANIDSLITKVKDEKWLQNLNIVGDGNEYSKNNVKLADKTWPVDCLSILNRNHEYWEKRGISKRILEKYNGGLAYKGQLLGRYVFPVYDFKNNKRLVGFDGRDVLSFENSKRPKWKIMGSKENFVFPHFNNDIICDKRELIIVESVGDHLSLMQAGIENSKVLFGTSLGTALKRFIIKSNLDKIIIATNNDAAKKGNSRGVGNAAALKLCKELKSIYAAPQIEVYLPLANDFGDQSEEENKEWYEKTNKNNE